MNTTTNTQNGGIAYDPETHYSLTPSGVAEMIDYSTYLAGGKDPRLMEELDQAQKALFKSMDDLRETEIKILRTAEKALREQGDHALAYELRAAWLEKVDDPSDFPVWENSTMRFWGKSYHLQEFEPNPMENDPIRWALFSEEAETYIGETDKGFDSAEAQWWAEGVITQQEKKCPACGCSDSNPCSRHADEEDEDGEGCEWTASGKCSFCEEEA